VLKSHQEPAALQPHQSQTSAHWVPRDHHPGIML
jgi:hypothetical protein